MRHQRDEKELEVIRAIAGAEKDRPVTMLNLNRYTAEAGYPDGKLYRAYLDGLVAFLPNVGAKVLWRTPVFGRVVGDQILHEVLAAWYPSHQAFLDLPKTNSAPPVIQNPSIAAITGTSNSSKPRSSCSQFFI